jgi:hypothetical protein
MEGLDEEQIQKRERKGKEERKCGKRREIVVYINFWWERKKKFGLALKSYKAMEESTEMIFFADFTTVFNK